MTTKEIVQALRCSATQEEQEKCEMCRRSKHGCFECINSYLQEAASLIEQMTAENAALREKVPQWISVEDRLPELGVPVLVNYIGTDELPSADGVVVWTDWGALWWEGSLADSESEVTVPITHWMPLPPAPNGSLGRKDKGNEP